MTDFQQQKKVTLSCAVMSTHGALLSLAWRKTHALGPSLTHSLVNVTTVAFSETQWSWYNEVVSKFPLPTQLHPEIDSPREVLVFRGMAAKANAACALRCA